MGPRTAFAGAAGAGASKSIQMFKLEAEGIHWEEQYFYNSQIFCIKWK